MIIVTLLTGGEIQRIKQKMGREEKRWYKTVHEKEVRKKFTEYKNLPYFFSASPGKNKGDWEDCEPIIVGYSIAVHSDKKGDEKLFHQAAIDLMYIRPNSKYSGLFSSGKEFRMCDLKSLKYKSRKDPVFKSYFDENKCLIMDKVKDFIYNQYAVVHIKRLENAPAAVLKYFRLEEVPDWRGKPTYQYKAIPKILEETTVRIEPVINDLKWIPDGDSQSRYDILSRNLFDNLEWDKNCGDARIRWHRDRYYKRDQENIAKQFSEEIEEELEK